ncbi:MAG: hypothetical protein IID33_03175 [Planctomycetes bacterium]|nr:hypothetical protein [Planctomycetota bacterium]
MPLSGGDAAAFDGTTSQADTAAAASTDNPNFVGKDWGSGNDKFMFDAKVYPSNNSGWTQAAGSGETATIQIRGHSAAPSTGAEGTLLGSDTAAGNSTSSVTITLDNATAWRYVWVYISISGSTDHDCYVAEVEFTETTAVKDMTLVSNAFTAVATPTDARMVMFEQDVDAVTLNTDLKAWASRDDGQTFTTDFGTDEKLDITAHTFANDDRITVSSTTTLPAGLSEGMLYYVVNKTANDFELSLTSGGAAVDITDDGSGTHTAFKWTQITLADEGDYETGRRILAGSADISGQPTGTDMKWILATHNTTEMRIHGVALPWS